MQWSWPASSAARRARAIGVVLASIVMAGCESSTGSVSQYDMTPDAKVDGTPAVANFVKALPADLLANYILMTGTESTQPGTPVFPRILLQGNDSKNIYCVATKLVDNKLTSAFVERIRWDDTSKKFVFSVLTPDATGTKLEEKSDATIQEGCAGCHGKALRPNWDAYDSWANMLPFHRDRIYDHVYNADTGKTIKTESQERLAYERIMSSMATHPVGKYLALPAGVTRGAAAPYAVTITFSSDGGAPAPFTLDDAAVTALGLAGVDKGFKVDQGGKYYLLKHPNGRLDEGQGVAMFDQLSVLNGEKLARQMKDDANYGKFKYVALGILEGCIPKAPTKADLEKWAAPAHLKSISTRLGQAADDYDKAYAKLATDTLALRKSLPAKKVKDASQIANMRELVLANVDARGKVRYNNNDYDRTALLADGEKVLHQIIVAELFRRIKEMDFDLDDKKLIVDREKYIPDGIDKRVTQWRFFLEAGQSLEVDKFSLSVAGRSETYTFADVFPQYQETIIGRLREDPDLKDLGCAKLETASAGQLIAALIGDGGGSGSGSGIGSAAVDAGVDATVVVTADAGSTSTTDGGTAGVDSGSGTGSGSGIQAP